MAVKVSHTGPGSMILGETASLCPVCLEKIDGVRIAEGDGVYLKKCCPDHGLFKTILWRGTAESFLDWASDVPTGIGSVGPLAGISRGCPFDCGLCPDHTGGACMVLLEVTNRCTLCCPFCFSSSGRRPDSPDPDMAEIEGMLQTILDSGGPFPVQLSGGEPTLRDDLPAIVALGKTMGFEMIQIDTNGLRCADDPAYLERLQKSGASTLYLQFDGLTDDIHLAIRGTAMQERKARVIENCAAVGLGVVLVVLIVPGVNDHHMGEIIRFAKTRMPVVRGVHFQPVSYFGRYPHSPRDEDRITLPEVLAALESQTEGEISANDCKPKKNKEAHCSFAGLFVLGDDQVLKPLFSSAGKQRDREPDRAVRQFLQSYWTSADGRQCACPSPSSPFPTLENVACDLSRFVQARSLTLSGMSFQDAWNIDCARLKGCCIHVVTRQGRLTPFCARYLTGMRGKRLYGS